MSKIESESKPVHKLAGLRQLGEHLSQIEQERLRRIGKGDDRAVADRDAAQWALTVVADFLLDQRMQAKPLNRLLADLVALSDGAKPSRMLTQAPARHRRRDSALIENFKGRLAAVMEYRQKTGSSRKAAGEWVVRQLSPTMKRRLGASTRAAVDGWLGKWGGVRGASPGDGREGYLAMSAILAARRPTEGRLKRVIVALARDHLPA